MRMNLDRREQGVPIDELDSIRNMPTVVNKTHESVYRAYNILDYAKLLLGRGVDGETVLSLIRHLETQPQIIDK
jgi:hypothetical protein